MSAELDYGMGSSFGGALFESLPLPVVVLGGGLVLEMGNACWRALVAPALQVSNLTSSDLIQLPFQQACLRSGLIVKDEALALETGLSLVAEGRLTRFSTRLFPASGNSLLLVAARLEGAEGRLVVAVIDHAATFQGAVSVACIRGLVDASRDAVIGLSREGKILTWNGPSSEVFGYAAEEVRGQDISCITPPDRHPENHEILERLLKGERIDRLETIRKAKDGSHIDVLLSGFPLWDASGGIVGLTLVIRPQVLAGNDIEQTSDVHREISDLARLTGQPVAAVTALSFGLSPLSESNPDGFREFVDEYVRVLEQAMKERGFKVENSSSEALRTIAESLGQYRAGPRDVMDIHVAAIREITENTQPSVSQIYLSEGRLKVIELLGYLLAFYRNHAVIR